MKQISGENEEGIEYMICGGSSWGMIKLASESVFASTHSHVKVTIFSARPQGIMNLLLLQLMMMHVFLLQLFLHLITAAIPTTATAIIIIINSILVGRFLMVGVVFQSFILDHHHRCLLPLILPIFVFVLSYMMMIIILFFLEIEVGVKLVDEQRWVMDRSGGSITRCRRGRNRVLH